MAEAKEGNRFIQHEFDEAIVIQQAIVDSERTLQQEHPLPEAQQALKQMLKSDEQQLKTLQKLGRRFGATGKVEEVAGAMQELATQTTESSKGAPESEKYEAHAVLLNMKRKQQDSASAVVKMAQKLGDTELKTAATEMQKETKSSADELAGLLGQLAVQIATKGEQPAARA
jgi:thioredoxin-like negative regulator of GroEL